MVEPNVDAELVALDRQLGRLRRKARRLQHGQQQGSPHWTAWSSTTDAAFRVVDGVMDIPAEGLVGLAIKLSAVVWYLDDTDAVLDVKGMRQLRALAIEARRLARGVSPASQ